MVTKNVDPSNLISDDIKEKMEITDIAQDACVLHNVMMGIISLSAKYGKFFEISLPVLKQFSINPTDKKYIDFIRKTFINSFRMYFIEDDEKDEIDTMMEKFISRTYVVDAKFGMTYAISLQYLDKAFYRLSDDINNFVNDLKFSFIDIDNDYKMILADIYTVYRELVTIEESISDCFVNEKVNDIFNIDNIMNMKLSINNIDDVINESMKILDALDDCYLILNEISYSLNFCINIKDPMKLEDNIAKEIKLCNEYIEKTLQDNNKI